MRFLHAAAVPIQIFGCITWLLINLLKEKLDESYATVLYAFWNKSRKQHPTKQRLYDHQLPISQIIDESITKHAGLFWRSEDEFRSDILFGIPINGFTDKHWLRSILDRHCSQFRNLPGVKDDRFGWWRTLLFSSVHIRSKIFKSGLWAGQSFNTMAATSAKLCSLARDLWHVVQSFWNITHSSKSVLKLCFNNLLDLAVFIWIKFLEPSLFLNHQSVRY